MFLVDTNVWLEILLNQEKAEEARQFLTGVEIHRLFLSEFSLYSIGIILTNLGKDAVYREFVHDTLVESGVGRVRLTSGQLKEILDARRNHGLDFDDAYQFVTASRNGLRIVSFDSDFASTPGGSLTPAQALELVSRQ